MNKFLPMQKAIDLAKKAALKGEIPVGAVIVKDQKIIASGMNVRESKKNAIWHAEMVAIDKACKALGDWRLEGCTLFVTLEPCMMCLGACANARIDKVVFGAFDPKGKKQKLQQISALNHNLVVEGGEMEEECKRILQDFFKNRRQESH